VFSTNVQNFNRVVKAFSWFLYAIYINNFVAKNFYYVNINR